MLVPAAVFSATENANGGVPVNLAPSLCTLMVAVCLDELSPDRSSTSNVKEAVPVKLLAGTNTNSLTSPRLARSFLLRGIGMMRLSPLSCCSRRPCDESGSEVTITAPRLSPWSMSLNGKSDSEKYRLALTWAFLVKSAEVGAVLAVVVAWACSLTAYSSSAFLTNTSK